MTAGFLFILVILILATGLGKKYPEQREAIIAFYAVLGIFFGWKIIRNGEVKYRMAQVAVISDLISGKNPEEISSRGAIHRANSTFQYASALNLLKDIWKNKSLRNVKQFAATKAANMLPYIGTCSLSWVLAHPEESHEKSACQAITVYSENKKRLRPLILRAVVREVVLVFLLALLIFAVEWVIYWLVTHLFDLDGVLERVEDFTDTIELVYSWYFESGGYGWNPTGVMAVIALYLAWFIKVFSIRSYQTIAIIREYSNLGAENPPSDELYELLRKSWGESASRTKKTAGTESGENTPAESEEMTPGEKTAKEKESEEPAAEEKGSAEKMPEEQAPEKSESEI